MDSINQSLHKRTTDHPDIIITGFWMVQHQLYATMPKYVLRLAGEGASPSWYANVNPLVVCIDRKPGYSVNA